MYKRTNVTGDRFIPRRAGTDFESLNYMLLKDSFSFPEYEGEPFRTHCKKFTNQVYRRRQMDIYQKRLSSVVELPNKIFSFSNQSKKPEENVTYKLWPVCARKRPLIRAPTTVLDMPYLEVDVCHNIMDWSSKNYLASVFEGEVYLWHPETNKPYVITNTGGRVDKCIRWNKTATNFATSLDNKQVAVYDFTKNCVLSESHCTCPIMCTVTSIEWTKSNLLLIGCNLGRLSVWSSELKFLRDRYSAHSGAVIKICLSNSERHLATSGMDNRVRIWSWPEIKENFEIIYFSPATGVSWHPWKDLLAVGGGIGDGSLSIWNPFNHKQVGNKPASDHKAVSVDCLTWSSVTGELVVSYWHECERTRSSLNEGKNSILVLSNLNTEVDAIEWHTGRILYLLWGENGTQLATAATDENLCIWDFLGNSPEIIKKYKQENKKEKLTANHMETARSFGYCIR